MYLRRLLLAIFLFGLIGTTVELLLLAHFEDQLQVIPLALLALGFAALGWHGLAPSVRSAAAFRIVLLLFVAGGVLGLILHYRGNVEFEKERDATLGGFALFAEAVTGATPALSPGAMILLALLGYAALVAERPAGTTKRW